MPLTGSETSLETGCLTFYSSQTRLGEGGIISYILNMHIEGERQDQDTFAERSEKPISNIVDRAGRLSERVVATKNGRPEAVVMGGAEYQSWVETLELLSNPKAVKSFTQGLKEAQAGKFHSFTSAFGEEQ